MVWSRSFGPICRSRRRGGDRRWGRGPRARCPAGPRATPSRSIAAMVSTVPYFVSPVTCRGRNFHRNRARQRRSTAGRLSGTSAAVDDVVVAGAEARAPLGWPPRRGIRVRRACPGVRRPPRGAARFRAVGTPRLPDPVAAVRDAVGQAGVGLLGRGAREADESGLRARVVVLVLRDEEPRGVRLDGKPRPERGDHRVGVDVGRGDGPTPGSGPNVPSRPAR